MPSQEQQPQWFVTVEYAEYGDTKRPGKRWTPPAEAEIASATIGGNPKSGKGSTTISLGPNGVDTADQAREVGVRVANQWAEAWGMRPEPVNVTVGRATDAAIEAERAEFSEWVKQLPPPSPNPPLYRLRRLLGMHPRRYAVVAKGSPSRAHRGPTARPSL